MLSWVARAWSSATRSVFSWVRVATVWVALTSVTGVWSFRLAGIRPGELVIERACRDFDMETRQAGGAMRANELRGIAPVQSVRFAVRNLTGTGSV